MNQPLILVAGLGKTGQSIAAYLRRRNKPFVVFDTRREVECLSEFTREFPGVDVFLGAFPTTLFDQLSEIITSPGVPLEEPFLQRAFQLNIPVYGDIECLAREIKASVIAITGTNGKSTVTALVGEMAKAAGFSVAVAGNIGLPVLELLDDGTRYDLWVLELSSFQLDLTRSLKPMAATILNITPDHLDRHHSLSTYIESKQRVYHQAQFLLYNREDKASYPIKKNKGQTANFGLDVPQVGEWGIVEKQGTFYLAFGSELLLAVEQLGLKGRHNWQNALAACALARVAGIKPELMIHVLKSFSGLPHRCQWLRNINGVDWINDSKGTNVGAAVSAISGIGGSMQGKIVLIAGGMGKGADFNPLCTPVAEYVRSVVLIGEDADKIEDALADIVPVLRASSLDSAVALAKAQAMPGDVVLLSPACASFDMFNDFIHRGDLFANFVGKL